MKLMKMINKIKIMYILFFVSMPCFASKYQEAFLKANNLYQQKSYKQAFDLYQSIRNKGPATWFNMGNCAYNMGDYIDAIIYFEKAKKNTSLARRKDIDFNLAIVYDRLGIAKEKTNQTYLYDIFNMFSLFLLQMFFLFFWFVFFISFVFIKRLRLLVLSSALFFSFLFSLVLFFKYRSINYPLAIVKSSASMFTGPNQKYHQIAEISAADKVVVQKIDKNWYKIKSNGVNGWVSAENIEII